MYKQILTGVVCLCVLVCVCVCVRGKMSANKCVVFVALLRTTACHFMYCVSFRDFLIKENKSLRDSDDCLFIHSTRMFKSTSHLIFSSCSIFSSTFFLSFFFFFLYCFFTLLLFKLTFLNNFIQLLLNLTKLSHTASSCT